MTTLRAAAEAMIAALDTEDQDQLYIAGAFVTLRSALAREEEWDVEAAATEITYQVSRQCAREKTRDEWRTAARAIIAAARGEHPPTEAK